MGYVGSLEGSCFLISFQLWLLQKQRIPWWLWTAFRLGVAPSWAEQNTTVFWCFLCLQNDSIDETRKKTQHISWITSSLDSLWFFDLPFRYELSSPKWPHMFWWIELDLFWNLNCAYFSFNEVACILCPACSLAFLTVIYTRTMNSHIHRRRFKIKKREIMNEDGFKVTKPQTISVYCEVADLLNLHFRKLPAATDGYRTGSKYYWWVKPGFGGLIFRAKSTTMVEVNMFGTFISHEKSYLFNPMFLSFMGSRPFYGVIHWVFPNNC